MPPHGFLILIVRIRSDSFRALMCLFDLIASLLPHGIFCRKSYRLGGQNNNLLIFNTGFLASWECQKHTKVGPNLWRTYSEFVASLLYVGMVGGFNSLESEPL